MKLKSGIDRSKHLWTRLRQKGWRYWLTVFVLLAIGTGAGELLNEYQVWIDLRYRIYKKVQDATTWTKKERRTVLVLIDDEDYWKGPLERRVPLKRDYIAGLLEELAKGEPTVIALDIDLRSPIPKQGTADLHSYQWESDKLLETIKKVSEKRKIVLATSVTPDRTKYVLEPNIFDGYAFDQQRVLHGYTSLHADIRRVPLSVELGNRAEREDSFASAIARTRDAEVVAAAEEFGEIPFGDFYGPNYFQKLTAGEVLRIGETALREKVQGRVVIVGGAWHTGTYQGTDRITDDSVDLHLTPVGLIHGAYVHANYVEALLSGTVHRGLFGPVAIAIEVFCSLIVAISFALNGSLRQRFGRVVIVCGGVVMASYVLWQNFGWFFDFFIPIVLLSAHAPIEEYRETRAELKQLKKKPQKARSTESQSEALVISEKEEVVVSTG